MAIPKFKNEPFTDFTKNKNRKDFQKALKKIRERFGKEYPIIIGNEEIYTDEKSASYNPSKPEEIIGVFQRGTPDIGDKAITTAFEAFKTWKDVPAKKRANYLFKAAKEMRKRKHEFSAMMVYEVGKNWAEADGDTAEAIDFLEFYGREMLRLSEKQPLTKISGEDNNLEYIPLGVCVVIPPWNFPCAIAIGMTAAAIVAGNTVALKPSEDSPAIAQMFIELFQQVGVPPGVINFVPGQGSIVGEVMVQHPLTRLIAFTGSMEVGLRINEVAAKKQPSQIWIKRVIAEMGGKDAIIVDKELHSFDDAVAGVVASAFGFSGQKCSACSRVIVDESIYDKFCEALVEKTSFITVGDTVDNPQMGPVINKKAMENTLEYITKAQEEGGKLISGGKAVGINGGFFIEPTIIKDVKPNDTIAQEEIFAPVLAVIKSKDYDDALNIANGTMFGLTGAVYTKNKKKLQRAYNEFHVGNLYFNRKCTGALVGVHPFGGFNMSGTDSKAGGRDYLLLFTQGKLISEKKIK
jgi:1-pyrroline-5-carboxylate dehydrogenase